MKLFSLFIALAFSSAALATPPVFNPKESTCEEIQSALESYGTVIIQKRYLLGQKYFVEASKTKQPCPRYHYSYKVRARTADGIKCRLGYSCEEWSND